MPVSSNWMGGFGCIIRLLALQLIVVSHLGGKNCRLDAIHIDEMSPARDPKQGNYMDLDLILIGFERFSIRMG